MTSYDLPRVARNLAPAASFRQRLQSATVVPAGSNQRSMNTLMVMDEMQACAGAREEPPPHAAIGLMPSGGALPTPGSRSPGPGLTPPPRAWFTCPE